MTGINWTLQILLPQNVWLYSISQLWLRPVSPSIRQHRICLSVATSTIVTMQQWLTASRKHVTWRHSVRDYFLEMPVVSYEKAVQEMPQILCKPKAFKAAHSFATVWRLRWCLQAVSSHKAYRLRYLCISTLNNCEGKLKEWFRVREILVEICNRELANSNDKCSVEVRTADWQKR
jgi:hypothetical protein